MTAQFPSSQYNDQASDITSIDSFRKNVANAVTFEDMRNKMVELFTGTSANLWFINELISVLPTVLPYNAGAIFINNICDKIAFTFKEWNESIIENCELLFKTPSGPRILITIFPMLTESQIIHLSSILFNNFPLWKVNSLRQSFDYFKPSQSQVYLIELFRRYIVYWRNQPEIFRPLLDIDFFSNPNYLFILIIILLETNDTQALNIFLANFDSCAQSQKLHFLITMVYFKKDHQVRKTVFDKLMTNHSSDFLNEPQWRIFQAIAIDGDLNHRDQIAFLLEKSLNIENPPSYFGQLMTAIIWSLPIQARVEFFKRNRKELLRFTNIHQFSLMLQYNEMVLA